jgi:AraC family transcriptional regulator
MDAIAKTIWLIESSLDRDITLDEIAKAAGMSRFHLTRAFGRSLGRSVMHYMRGRRLSEAAKQLAIGAPDILSVALDAGYSSHEAFTRAFREEFGVTPTEFRDQPDLAKYKLLEPIRMSNQPNVKLAEPRMVDANPMLFVGIAKRYRFDDMTGIVGQWQAFNRHIGSIPNEIAGAAYGICTNSDADSMDYICAVEVSGFGLIDKDLQRLRVPAQRYAVFSHPGHISEIQAVFRTIYGEWLPNSGHESAEAPAIEYYGARFDPATGRGGYDIWIPVKS